MSMHLASRERLQPSLLDRLTDNAPGTLREAQDQQVLSFATLREAVLRDLAWLLNTTNLATTTDMEDIKHVATSTLNYGIPGFAGLMASNDRARALEGAIADAIRCFEPRIDPHSLKVRARAAGGGDRATALVFEIHGELWAQPVPKLLFLETAIELETRLAVVRDARPRA